MLRLLPDILTNASNQDPTIGTGEKDQTSRTSFWIWVAGSRSGSERRLHGALLLLASGDGQHFRATFAASQCMNQPVQSRETRTCMNHCAPIMICLPQDKSMSKFYFSRISLAPQAVHRRSFEYASEGYGGWCFLRTWDCLQGLGLRAWAAWVCNETFALQAAQTITKHFGSSHTALLLPPLEEASFGQLMSCRNKHPCKMLWYVVVSRWWKIIGQKYSMITDDSCSFSVVLWAFPSTRVCLMWPGSFDMVLCS